MLDAFQFALLWTMALGLVAMVPLTAVAFYAARRCGEPARERRARELRRLLLEEELYGGERCVECRERLDPDWVRCPVCTAEVRRRCDDCGTLLKLHWSACPECASALVVERLAEPDDVGVEVAHANLEHAPWPRDPFVHDVRAAAA